ncbi:TATA-binding protein-associated factor BTAF1 isoform X1 [Capsicum annuum]|uniref:TATA-binding protein-associated factor BTAF1 isoform X1 n=1 Tax=Capsicum annuum TaxID=4072 RepID=UPI0007BF0985|nr:TATA-binding protein-associated factor BTAF1 isoform X1 [Capsicum annuum]
MPKTQLTILRNSFPIITLRINRECVTYLRLDGSVEPEKRFDIVKAFNSDPTIDVLLLTTRVGGLGLNLTSADTLVFMEHDWNPMRDHQDVLPYMSIIMPPMVEFST